MMREISGINEMEEKLKELLNLQEVVIVPGDSDETPWVKQELGRACAKRMKKRLVGKNTIAVAGGSTMAAVADMISADFIGDSDTVFVPARGGIGEDVKMRQILCVPKWRKTQVQNTVSCMFLIK